MARPVLMKELLHTSLTRAGMSSAQQASAHVCHTTNQLLKTHKRFRSYRMSAVSFREGILTVHVVGTSSTIDASMLTHYLKACLNKELGTKTVLSIRYFVR